MNRSLTLLQRFIGESINPVRLSSQDIPDEEFIKWRRFIKAVSDALMKRYTGNYCRSKTVRLLTCEINQIVKLNNTVLTYLHKKRKLWDKNPKTEKIKTGYLYTCTVLDDLVDHLVEVMPEIRGFIFLSDISRQLAITGLKGRFAAVKEILNKDFIAEEFRFIIIRGINQLIYKKNTTREITDYIKELMERIRLLDVAEEEQMITFLLKNDFNLPEFFLYCVHFWQNHIDRLPGLHEQKEYLLKEKQHVYLISLENDLKMSWRKETILSDSAGFLAEQYLFSKQLLKVRRELVADQDKLKNQTRFLINLPVPQFGLFIRMQIERGFLMKEHIGDLFTFFATHFYTPNTTFISADSLQKKSTDVEFATAQKLKGHLIGMLNWLNTHYNLSNYN